MPQDLADQRWFLNAGNQPQFATAIRAGFDIDWNISLFHYRNYGAEYGRVLMGIQVPEEDEVEFQRFLKATGYPHQPEGDNIAYRMFVGPPGAAISQVRK